MKRRHFIGSVALGALGAPIVSGAKSIPATKTEGSTPMLDFAISASRTALINVDMQNVFVHGSPIAAPDGLVVLKQVNRISKAFRQAGATIVHTRHVLRPDRSNVGVMGEVMPNVRDGFMSEDAERTQLYPGLEVVAGDIVLTKPRFGAFTATDLDLILRARHIEAVVITGIATNICCETTAREAYAHNYRMLFVSDATCTFDMNGATAAEIQKVTCASLSFGFGQVLTTADLLRKL
jgi:nicotinamidase-related amidase